MTVLLCLCSCGHVTYIDTPARPNVTASALLRGDLKRDPVQCRVGGRSQLSNGADGFLSPIPLGGCGQKRVCAFPDSDVDHLETGFWRYRPVQPRRSETRALAHQFGTVTPCRQE